MLPFSGALGLTQDVAITTSHSPLGTPGKPPTGLASQSAARALLQGHQAFPSHAQPPRRRPEPRPHIPPHMHHRFPANNPGILRTEQDQRVGQTGITNYTALVQPPQPHASLFPQSLQMSLTREQRRHSNDRISARLVKTPVFVQLSHLKDFYKHRIAATPVFA